VNGTLLYYSEPYFLPMKHKPKVSVVVPTYNCARFLPEALASVLAQTFTYFELIVVGNCSTDNTSEVMKQYLADDRVSKYKNETNIGLANNWNKC
jgi:glycosyltransferase involved in cell wall biosynthesis